MVLRFDDHPNTEERGIMAGGYKCWRSRTDAELHVICADGSEAFEALPVRIRNLGPWAGGREGEINDLRLPYRVMLAEQGFVVVHAHGAS